MSRRIVWTLAAVLAAAGPSMAATAQSPGPRPATEVARNLDELMPRLEAARVAMEEAQVRQRQEDADAEHPATDTIAVGPLKIVIRPNQTELASELFGEVWSESFADVTGSPGLERRYFTFEWTLSPDRIYLPETEGAPVSRVELSRLQDRTRARVKDRIRFEVAQALVDDFDRTSPIGVWLTGVARTDLDPTAAHYQLALAASLGGPFLACLSGDPDACWTMNGLDAPDPSRSLAEAFTMEERRTIIRRWVASLPEARRRRLGAFAEGDQILACIERGSDEACAQMTPDVGPLVRGMMGAGNALRWSLFWHAVRLGGPGAWERALADQVAPPGDLLADVSGLDRRALTASWLGMVEADRPAAAALAGAPWAFLCMLIFAALALRSTRWRLA